MVAWSALSAVADCAHEDNRFIGHDRLQARPRDFPMGNDGRPSREREFPMGRGVSHPARCRFPIRHGMPEPASGPSPIRRGVGDSPHRRFPTRREMPESRRCRFPMGEMRCWSLGGVDSDWELTRSTFQGIDSFRVPASRTLERAGLAQFRLLESVSALSADSAGQRPAPLSALSPLPSAPHA